LLTFGITIIEAYSVTSMARKVEVDT